MNISYLETFSKSIYSFVYSIIRLQISPTLKPNTAFFL